MLQFVDSRSGNVTEALAAMNSLVPDSLNGHTFHVSADVKYIGGNEKRDTAQFSILLPVEIEGRKLNLNVKCYASKPSGVNRYFDGDLKPIDEFAIGVRKDTRVTLMLRYCDTSSSSIRFHCAISGGTGKWFGIYRLSITADAILAARSGKTDIVRSERAIQAQPDANVFAP